MISEASRKAKRKYNNSPRGRAKQKEWRERNRERAREIAYSYESGVKGLAADKRYRDSEKGKSFRENYVAKNKITLAIRNRERSQGYKRTVLTHYGGGVCACVVCGETTLACLSIDHVESNGAAHRKQVRPGGMYIWLIKNDYPVGFQTMCMNCQFIKKDREIVNKLNQKISDHKTAPRNPSNAPTISL